MRYTELVEECRASIEELFPWDLSEWIEKGGTPLLVDVREPYEFRVMHIDGSINIPRGILEPACEYGFEETVPEMVEAREKELVVVCRSGNRSALAAWVLQRLGYTKVYSLKTGLKGWNDYEQPLVDSRGRVVTIDESDEYFTPRLSPEQLSPR